MDSQRWARQLQYVTRYLEWRKARGLTIEPVAMTSELCLKLHREVDELLDEVPWKDHRTYDLSDPDPVTLSNVREELVDIIKYVWTVAQVWGIKQQELDEEFDVKTDVVEDRWRQEHDLTPLNKIVLLDLDGVLNDYPLPFLRFCEQRGVAFDWGAATPRSLYLTLRDDHPEVFAKMKHAYRTSGIKRTLPAKLDSVSAARDLSAAGYDIVIMSQRPYRSYSRIYGDTLYWLRDNGVPFSRLYFVDDKQRRLLFAPLRDRIVFAVDDDPDVVDRLRDLGIKTYLLGGEAGAVDRIVTMYDIPAVLEAQAAPYTDWRQS